MATILAKIQINPGKEALFEEVMALMYKQTHDTEPDTLRYEYWRGRDTGFYYCLLSFTDNLAFWQHQASDHHEGEAARFQECIASIDLEVVDPVSGSSPLPPASDAAVPADAPDLVRQQAEIFPLPMAAWWAALRG